MHTERRQLFWRTMRFAIVGLTCTGIYVGVSLLVLRTGASLTVSHVTGYAVSIVCSYLGQKAFTFRVRGQHRRSSWRFAIATGSIALVQYLLVLSMSRFGIAPELILFVSALFYPVASYLVHTFWTFRRNKGEYTIGETGVEECG